VSRAVPTIEDAHTTRPSFVEVLKHADYLTTERNAVAMIGLQHATALVGLSPLHADLTTEA
jgi:hypothetical protein